MKTILKPISLEIDEEPINEQVDQDGGYKFSLYTSNCCTGEFEDAIQILRHIWDLETDVNLTINVRTKSIYEELYIHHSFNDDGTIDKESKPLFDALRKDCQWIIDQIDGLKESD
jgi:hypothetical protein